MRSLIQHIARNATTSQSVMVRIATAAVAVSIAVVIISLSVIIGFKEQISTLVSGSISDISILSPYAERQPEQYPISDNESLLGIITSTENIAHTERYAMRSCVIRGEKGAVGIALKGIGSEANTALFAERLESGALPRIEESRRKELLLSQSVASKIGAATNSRVELLLLEGDTPHREVFKVCGIYRSALGETGAELALTDIRNVQKLNGWESSQISGYACRVYDNDASYQTADIVNLRLMHEYEGEDSLYAISAKEQHSVIFGWLETHDVNATVIITIMLVVAIFNMVTALLILVLERTRMVGILKSMGMSTRSISMVFLAVSARTAAKGMVLGNLLAMIFCIIQGTTHILKLNPENYYVSFIPVDIDPAVILMTDVISFVLIMILLLIPCLFIAKVDPARTVSVR
mgnify:CR=1 FL=1